MFVVIDIAGIEGEAKCNISEAARKLGLHRTQLRRQMDLLGIELEHVRQLDK